MLNNAWHYVELQRGSIADGEILSGIMQDTAPLWNLRGVLNNAWHRVELRWGSIVDEDENPEGLHASSI